MALWAEGRVPKSQPPLTSQRKIALSEQGGLGQLPIQIFNAPGREGPRAGAVHSRPPSTSGGRVALSSKLQVSDEKQTEQLGGCRSFPGHPCPWRGYLPSTPMILIIIPPGIIDKKTCTKRQLKNVRLQRFSRAKKQSHPPRCVKSDPEEEGAKNAPPCSSNPNIPHAATRENKARWVRGRRRALAAGRMDGLRAGVGKHLRRA